MKKPIITIKRNPSLGTIIVVRSPFSRKWLFNLSIAPSRETLEINTHINNILGKGAYTAVLLLVVASFFLGCDPTAPEADPVSSRSAVNTQYVADSLTVFKSCWFTSNAKDSLIVAGRKYTVSTRSRYRAEIEPVTFGDVEAEGAVTLINPRFFLDTKATQDSVIVLNSCGVK